jgi:mono/diheme cytochrome c family protein
VIAAPISYAVDGEQYIAVVAGWGGAFALLAGEAAVKGSIAAHRSRVLAFRLGGKAQLPPAEAFRKPVLEGSRLKQRMPNFAQVLTPELAETVRAYLVSHAHETFPRAQPPGTAPTVAQPTAPAVPSK